MGLSIADYLRRGPATSKEIQVETGFSQAAVSRQLKGLGNSVIRIPGERPPRYAMTRNAFGGDDRLPLYMVDAHGNNTSVAVLRPLAHGGFFVQARTGMPSVLLGEGKKGYYEDLPYFLDDLKPQGFLGRQIAVEIASQSDDFPSDLRDWNASHIGRYLVSNGDDLPGNFKFGQQAHLRVRRQPTPVTIESYSQLAESVMAGVIPGSSAGGEQPKFTAFCGDRSAHVIVKFSPSGEGEVAKRWKDILISEFHATEAIHSKNFPAAETKLIEMDGRLFLESQRFDRVGEYGRMPMISLLNVDAEFTGIGSNWPKVMTALHKQSLVSWQHLYDATYLWAFGRLINNTDMHLGNLSLGIDGNVFRLLPVYDMCSMGFAPKSGEVSPYMFNVPELDGSLEIDLNSVKEMAHSFWERVAGDPRISDEMKSFLEHGNPMETSKQFSLL